MANISETIKILEKLIAFPTISANSNIDLISYVAEFLENNKVKVAIIPNELNTKPIFHSEVPNYMKSNKLDSICQGRFHF